MGAEDYRMPDLALRFDRGMDVCHVDPSLQDAAGRTAQEEHVPQIKRRENRDQQRDGRKTNPAQNEHDRCAYRDQAQAAHVAPLVASHARDQAVVALIGQDVADHVGRSAARGASRHPLGTGGQDVAAVLERKGGKTRGLERLDSFDPLRLHIHIEKASVLLLFLALPGHLHRWKC